MRLSAKLLGFLNRAFDKDPAAFLAFRLRYDGQMQWRVADGRLTTTIQGGVGAPLSIDLSAYTVGTLAGFLQLQTGYSIADTAGAELAGASALRLVEGGNDQAVSNGDHLTAYGSILHAYIDTLAVELATAEAAIGALPDELATVSANGSWLDYLGSYYNVPRFDGEADQVYSNRIISEVLRPLGNNVAMEAAIATYTGQKVRITDVVSYNAPEPRFSGLPKWDGTYHFQPTVQPVYGLFDAAVGYDLLGGDIPTAFIARIRSVIERLRDAGTHLRAFSLGGSVLQDNAPWPAEAGDTLVVSHRRRFDGQFAFNGGFQFGGNVLEAGYLAGATSSDTIGGQPLPVQILVGGLPVGILIPDELGNPIRFQVLYDPLGGT